MWCIYLTPCCMKSYINSSRIDYLFVHCPLLAHCRHCLGTVLHSHNIKSNPCRKFSELFCSNFRIFAPTVLPLIKQLRSPAVTMGTTKLLLLVWYNVTAMLHVIEECSIIALNCHWCNAKLVCTIRLWPQAGTYIKAPARHEKTGWIEHRLWVLRLNIMYCTFLNVTRQAMRHKPFSMLILTQ